MQANITIDARWLVGGIGTYTRHLLSGLQESGNGFRIRAITREQHKREVEAMCNQVSILDVPIYTAREQWKLPRMASGCDLLHVPHYNAPVFTGVPLVITLHDIIHLSHASYRKSYKSRLYARPMLKWITRKARHIITVSEYSRAQIIERLQVSPEKVTAIYNGVNDDFVPLEHRRAGHDVAQILGFKEPYILYVGSLKKYKNVSVLLKAFADCTANKSHRLVIVGDSSNRKDELRSEAAVMGIAAKTTIVHDIEQKLLPALYSAADVFVMPSTMEGFGLPVIEAMACGTPVISSDATCLPEVGGDAVLYFDPHSPTRLTEHLDAMLRSKEMRQQFREKGLRRARQFTWRQCVAKHMEVYSRVLQNNL